ncbi:oligomeric golgi complex subunit-like protein [Rhynchospora pubera]|uniref:Conserved oligomeric Golgi complex subunit 2 n=1 Tax=Rhynchospora pubera TaxID=906938 RepID=A0AAV8C9K9_9POAL|nr:oligomeric golgi complex subunit-like protein [Rhynchospora pubera]
MSMAAVATATDLFGEPIEAHPTWFTPAAFLSSDFSPSSYISSLRSYVPLETLATELTSHLTSLNSDLIDLVNRDYADFVGLGSRLAGAGDAAAPICAPLAELRSKVAALRGAAATQLVELRAGMERRAAAAASRQLLERMLDTFHVVSKVEKLIKELPTAPSDFAGAEVGSVATDGTLQNLESGNSSRITRSLLLERIASEINRLKFYIGGTKNLPFIENMEKRIQAATSLLDNSLEQCFVQGLEHRDNNAIYNCLRAYAAVDNTTAAEVLFRKTVVSPLIQDIIAYSGSNQSEAVATVSSDELEEDYQRIMQCVEKDCKFILELSSSANSGLHVFDFLANSILKEVLSAIQKGKPGAFSPGKPTEFLKNYKSSLAFLAFLEGYCPTKAAVVRFRSETVYAEFMRQWNVGVYFSLRFQEIAGTLDSSLTGPIKPIKSRKETQKLLLKQSIQLLESLKTCWSNDVLVFSHCDKFLRLSLQLLSRYSTWLSNGLAACRAHSGDADWAISAPVEDFVYVFHDVSVLISELSGDFLGHVSQLLSNCSDEVVWLVRESIAQASQLLQQLLPVILDTMIESIVEKSVEDLRQDMRQLKGITAMTNKLPVRHSPYVSAILRPLKVFLEGERSAYLTKEAAHNLLLGSAEKITNLYYELASDLVHAARKREFLLQRLRQGAQRRVGASSDASDDNISNTEKICMQLFCDIQEYGRNLAGIGINAAEIPSYRSLWQCVAPEERHSVIAF